MVAALMEQPTIMSGFMFSTISGSAGMANRRKVCHQAWSSMLAHQAHLTTSKAKAASEVVDELDEKEWALVRWRFLLRKSTFAA